MWTKFFALFLSTRAGLSNIEKVRILGPSLKIERVGCPQTQVLFGKDEKGLFEHPGNQSSLKYTLNGSLILITGTLATPHLKFSTCRLLKAGFWKDSLHKCHKDPIRGDCLISESFWSAFGSGPLLNSSRAFSFIDTPEIISRQDVTWCSEVWYTLYSGTGTRHYHTTARVFC